MKLLSVKYLCVKILFLVISLHAFAMQNIDSSQRTVVLDLKNGWMSNEQGVLKLVSDPAKKHKVILFFITRVNLQEGDLAISVPAGSAIFADKILLAFFEKDTICFLHSRELIGKRDETLISIYGKALSSNNLKTVILSKSYVEQSPATSREKSPFKDYFLLVFVIGLVLTVILKGAAPNISNEFFQVGRTMNFRNREELIFKAKFFSSPNPLFYLLVSFFSSFLVVSLFFLSPDSFTTGLDLRQFNFFQLIGFQILILAGIYLWILFKWLLIRYLSELFRLRDFSTIHFFNYERYSLQVLLFVAILTAVIFLIFGEGVAVYPLMVSIIVIAAGYRILLMFLKLLNESTYRVFHLFSYLCATEIIPYFIAIKLILI